MDGSMMIMVESKCAPCNRGEPCGFRRGAVIHSERDANGRAIQGAFVLCGNFDSECRHAAEAFGFYIFAWKPRRCRNGRLRWLTWLERHADGTFTLGNRAH